MLPEEDIESIKAASCVGMSTRTDSTAATHHEVSTGTDDDSSLISENSCTSSDVSSVSSAQSRHSILACEASQTVESLSITLEELIMTEAPQRKKVDDEAIISQHCRQKLSNRKNRRGVIIGCFLVFCAISIFFFLSYPGVTTGRRRSSSGGCSYCLSSPWSRFIPRAAIYMQQTIRGFSIWKQLPGSGTIRGRIFGGFSAKTYFDLFSTSNSPSPDDAFSLEAQDDSRERRLNSYGIGAAILGKSRTRSDLGDSSKGTDSSASGHNKNNADYASKLVVAGQMILEEGPCNVAQLNLETLEWSPERIQLSLYNSYSGGEVYSILANYTPASERTSEHDVEEITNYKSPQKSEDRAGGELIVVGAFDTTYQNSQVTYCSVGKWNGISLEKVGEGLCNSALSNGMKITCVAMAGPQDLYVAGSFHTQVWNGDRHAFVKIYNVAHFNAVEQVWLPLPVGQISCSWCTVTVLALAWDSKRRQLHIAGKFNAIDGENVPAGLAIYDAASGHLVAHPGGGLSMHNVTQDGVGTALQLDERTGVLYVMGSFERLTATGETCLGLAAWEIAANRWTCVADAAHSVVPTGGGNMLLTPYGLMVAGKTTRKTTWPDNKRPYTIGLLKTTLKQALATSHVDDDLADDVESGGRDFKWSWLPGFDGHDEPIHTLSNGFGDHEGTVFIGGDSLIASWRYEKRTEPVDQADGDETDRRISTIMKGGSTTKNTQPKTRTILVPVTRILTENIFRGAVMAISQITPKPPPVVEEPKNTFIGLTLVVYLIALGALIGMSVALLCNKNLTTTIMSVIFSRESQMKGISLDTLTYSAVQDSDVAEVYQRAMRTRFVHEPHLLRQINPQEIVLHRIIGEGTFGRVWSASWRSASVAVKEFVFAQAAVAGKSSMQREIIEEIVGEAGMMAILRHPNVLQLFGCSLTAQAIWIVSELCSLGSLRQLLDNNERHLPLNLRLRLALQVAEGMCYLHNQKPPIIHRDLKSHNIFVHETVEEETKTPDAEGSKSPEPPKKEKAGLMKKRKKKKHHGTKQQHSKEVKPKTKIVAKIGDWGSARATLSGSRTMTHGVGTACWLAPEVIRQARSSKYSDVYGFGIVLWELATREEVYRGLETTQIIAQVANNCLRPPVPQDCPWKDLMVKCWAENPLERLTFDEIVKELNSLLQASQVSQASQESIANNHSSE